MKSLLQNKSEKSFKAYKKHKKICSRLYKKQRKRFFNNLNPSFVTDNKLFWKTIQPIFSNKGNYGLLIKLVEKHEVLQDDDLIAKELNKFFKNAACTLNIEENSFIIHTSSDGITVPIDKALDKYKFHPSIFLIRKHLKNHYVFTFKAVEIGNIEKETTTLILRRLQLVTAFLQNLKLADITPVYKKSDPLDDKANYRPVSVLPVVSKVSERIIQKQINDFIVSFLSPYLCGYRKGFNTQHALLTLADNRRNKGFLGTILMQLSKAFGFQHDALKLLHSYVSKRWYRTKLSLLVHGRN